jgi:hypothetical protein
LDDFFPVARFIDPLDVLRLLKNSLESLPDDGMVIGYQNIDH